MADSEDAIDGMVGRLTGLVATEGRFDIPYAELGDLQVRAIDERFQSRRHRIKLLGHRAAEAGLDGVRSIQDAVALLFPHTAYKSYPESWLSGGRWDRMTKWIATVSSDPFDNVDLDAVADVDDWLARLAARGHFVACSSGTTGKPAMLTGSQRDMDWFGIDTINVFSWGSGVQPARDRLLVGCAPVARTPKNNVGGDAQRTAFADPRWGRIDYPAPPITVGSLTNMVAMRRAIAAGTARPDDIAAFERTSAARQSAMDDAIQITADRIVENRARKLMLAGLWSGLYAVAKAVRDRGYAAKDFDPDNCVYVGGGLKRAQLPPDYQAFVHETFNIPEDRHFQNYSMQELNSGMPKCRECGRYHVPPWIVPMILNKAGDALETAHGVGEVEGRAAFFDLSLDGRWGGVITGDRISIDYAPNGCRHRGPSIRDDITRYADLEGDDKIGCAGTVDAYVRGVA